MKFSERFKYLWWILLMIVCSISIIQRFQFIKDGSLSSFDSILLGALILLVFLPFFAEMSILGFTLKKDISELKNEVKDEIQEMKNFVQNSIGLSNRLNSNIYVGNITPDEHLGKLEIRIREVIKKTMNEKGIIRLSNINYDFDISEDDQIMLFARYQLELELRRIWLNNFEGYVSEKSLYSISSMVKDLIINDIISNELGNAIKKAYDVCSAAIHGREKSSNKIRFIKDVFPELIATLKQINQL